MRGGPWSYRLGVGRETDVLRLQSNSCNRTYRCREANLVRTYHNEVKVLNGPLAQEVNKEYETSRDSDSIPGTGTTP